MARTPAKLCILSLLFTFISVTELFATGFRTTYDTVISIKTSEAPRNLANPDARFFLMLCTVSYSNSDQKAFYESLNILVRDQLVINYKKFLQDMSRWVEIKGYRQLFGSLSSVDSLRHFDINLRMRFSVYPREPYLLVRQFDTLSRSTDSFYFNYRKKFNTYKPQGSAKDLSLLAFLPEIYNYYDRDNSSVNSVWMLNIGIDDNGEIKYKNCGSDARAYDSFFRASYAKFTNIEVPMFFKSIVLVDSTATKNNILNALRNIADKAGVNDYFIFTFSGESIQLTRDSINYTTYFSPFGGKRLESWTRKTADSASVLSSMISLDELQARIQMIPCKKQLFISEAGPSGKFKTELIKTMIQHSPAIASLLNVDRVVIVPNGYGYDELTCNEVKTGKAPITYFITTLQGVNIYDLWNESKASTVIYKLKQAAYNCGFMDRDYFDVFQERKFLQEYWEITGDNGKTRGGKTSSTQKELSIGSFSGERYALVIGTDNYKAKEWDHLNNPVYDAREIAEVMNSYYDYKVKLLIDSPMDSIYNAIRNYYQQLKPADQLVVYIAGHGDFDAGLLDDGFIVCADSKSTEEDPLRNTYIQHTKLKKMINKIPSKQILVLLDICHGGVFDEAVLGKNRDNPASNLANGRTVEYLKEKSEFTTRKLLSSVGTESAFDGRAGKHSPFASYLINILKAGGGKEEILTLSDIYSVLQKASLNESETLKISPHIAGFGNNDPLSEFILIPVKKTE